jgi:predicted GTPase
MTFETTVHTVRWFGHEHEELFTLIDTPGLGDCEGRDEHHIQNMIEKLKEVKSDSAYLIVLNATYPRFDEYL